MKMTYLVLAVDPRLDLAALDERNDMSLKFLDTPAERCAHARELDRRERREVEHKCARANEVRQRRDVRVQMVVEQVACLQETFGETLSCSL